MQHLVHQSTLEGCSCASANDVNFVCLSVGFLKNIIHEFLRNYEREEKQSITIWE